MRNSGDYWADSTLVLKMKEKQDQDSIFLDLKENSYKQRALAFEKMGDGVLMYQCEWYVSRVDGLQERIMKEDHNSRYSIHSGSTKM